MKKLSLIVFSIFCKIALINGQVDTSRLITNLRLGVSFHIPLIASEYDFGEIKNMPPIFNLEFNTSNLVKNTSLDINLHYNRSNSGSIVKSTFLSSLGSRLYFNEKLKGFNIGVGLGYLKHVFEDTHAVYDHRYSVVNGDTLYYKRIINNSIYLIPNIGYTLTWGRVLLSTRLSYYLKVYNSYDGYSQISKENDLYKTRRTLQIENPIDLTITLGFKL